MGGRTLVILARPHDPVALTLAERWSAEDAGLNDICIITPWDLSTAGWAYRSCEPDASVAMSQGRRLQAGEIDGVVTRLPCVFEEDLGHMQPVDRGYAATEMTAFLLAWLLGLNCPIVNRPTPTALWGPSWRHEKWVRTADALGMPVEPARRRIISLESLEIDAKTAASDTVTVTIVGKRHLGDVDHTLVRHAQRLADAAGVDMLSVRFSGAEMGARFLGASIWPETVTDDMADALLSHLRV